MRTSTPASEEKGFPHSGFIHRPCVQSPIERGSLLRDLFVGKTVTRTLTLNADHVQTFADLTGDYNPLHFDQTFASRTKFKKLVVQGGLTTGLLHALVAMDIPGPGTVFLSQNWKFTAPVFIGDTIDLYTEVS